MTKIWQPENGRKIIRYEELEMLKIYFEDYKKSVVLVEGPTGIGKSYLARQYAEMNKLTYSDIVTWDGYNIPRNLNLSSNTLLIIDNADKMESVTLDLIRSVNRNINVIVTLRDSTKLKSEDYPCINLSGFSMGVFNKLIKDSIKSNLKIDNALLEFYFERTHGNPRLLMELIYLMRQLKLTSVDKLIYESAIIDDREIVIPEKKIETPTLFGIKNDVSNINEQLMKYIAENPTYMHELTSRDFEEMMAKLFAKMGYSVELTKKTRDGGKDIYIAKKNEIGKFLFLVECKKYAPNNPVGVDVVRNLYGVMGMEERKPTGGIIATTSHFTRDAQQQIIESNLEHRISLHDYDYISGLLKREYLK